MSDPEPDPNERSSVEERHEPTKPEDPPPTLEEQLDALRADLATAEGTQAKAESTVTELKSRLANLTTFQNDITKATSDYGQAYSGLKSQQEVYSAYLANESTCLEGILAKEIPDIEKAIAACNLALTTAKTAETQANTELGRLKAVLLSADSTRTDAESHADDLKRLAAVIADRFKLLEETKTNVNTEHEAGNYSVAYWQLVLIKDFEKTLAADPKLVPPDDLPALLLDAATKLDEAEAAHAKADADVKTQQGKVAEASALVTDLEKGLDTKIREALLLIEPSQTNGP